VLLQEALRGRNRLAAVEVIFNRLEGRSTQQIQVADVTKQLRDKTDDELRFHLAHNRWPEADELPPPMNEPDEPNGQPEKEKE
jgi:hypothetical protein